MLNRGAQVEAPRLAGCAPKLQFSAMETEGVPPRQGGQLDFSRTSVWLAHSLTYTTFCPFPEQRGAAQNPRTARDSAPRLFQLPRSHAKRRRTTEFKLQCAFLPQLFSDSRRWSADESCWSNKRRAIQLRGGSSISDP